MAQRRVGRGLKYLSLALAAALSWLPAGCSAEPVTPVAADLPELGLMGTIPIYWGESDGVGDLLSGEAAPHWARAQLEKSYRLRPLDALSAESLAGLKFVLLAQPRALGAAENVALDDWVRGGGHLLIFADPMLTGWSRFPLGDRRRPQDVILLSPILDHWGLQLLFDADRPEGLSLVDAIPVNLPGTFAITGEGEECVLSVQDILAECRLGKGRVAVLADAALLDLHDPHPQAAAAFDRLLSEGFAKSGK